MTAGDVGRVCRQRRDVHAAGAVDLGAVHDAAGRRPGPAAGLALHAVVVLGVVHVAQLEALAPWRRVARRGRLVVRDVGGGEPVAVAIAVAVARRQGAHVAARALPVKDRGVCRHGRVLPVVFLLFLPVEIEQHHGDDEQAGGADDDADYCAGRQHLFLLTLPHH